LQTPLHSAEDKPGGVAETRKELLKSSTNSSNHYLRKGGRGIVLLRTEGCFGSQGKGLILPFSSPNKARGGEAVGHGPDIGKGGRSLSSGNAAKPSFSPLRKGKKGFCPLHGRKARQKRGALIFSDKSPLQFTPSEKRTHPQRKEEKKEEIRIRKLGKACVLIWYLLFRQEKKNGTAHRSKKEVVGFDLKTITYLRTFASVNPRGEKKKTLPSDGGGREGRKQLVGQLTPKRFKREPPLCRRSKKKKGARNPPSSGDVKEKRSLEEKKTQKKTVSVPYSKRGVRMTDFRRRKSMARKIRPSEVCSYQPLSQRARTGRIRAEREGGDIYSTGDEAG